MLYPNKHCCIFSSIKIDLLGDENEKSGINEVFSKKMIKIASAKVEIAAPGDT